MSYFTLGLFGRRISKSAHSRGFPTSSVSTDSASEIAVIEAQPAAYVYKPLRTDADSIRLLILEPRQDDQIRCTLEHVAFRDKPSYEAMSYRWGRSTALKSILMDGVEVSIRENLYWALFTLRKTRPRALWIDALCIDQENNEDKAQQIPLMELIYTRAHMVLIWLGTYPHKKQGRFESNKFLQAWAFNNAYWRRLWIIQELGLARRLKVYFDDESMDWLTLIHLIPQQPHSRTQERTGVYHVWKLHLTRQNRNGPDKRLETLLETFQYAECTETRDKIYGLLALASDCSGDSIKVDYNKSTFQLYEDVISHFTRRQRTPDNTLNQSMNQSLRRYDRSMRIVRYSQLLCKTLMWPAPPEVPTSFQNMSLVTASCACVHEIQYLGPTFTELMTTNTASNSVKLNIHDCYPDGLAAAKVKEKYDMYLNHLLKIGKQESSRVHGFQPRQLYSRCVNTGLAWKGDGGIYGLPGLEPQLEMERKEPDMHNLTRYVDESRFFLGKRELMGLAPAEAQLGDRICIFWESDVTALIRKEEESDVYRLVGRLNISMSDIEAFRSRILYWNLLPGSTERFTIRMSIETLHRLTL